MNDFCSQLPVFTQKKSVYGYELIFGNRTDASEHAPQIPADTATPLSAVFAPFEFSEILGDRPGLIAFPDHLFQEAQASRFNARPLEAAFIKQIGQDKPLAGIISMLKKKGCRFSVCARIDPHNSTLRPSGILKFNFRAASYQLLTETIPQIGSGKPVTLFAGDISTDDELKSAAKLGFTLFQGSFFKKPDTLAAKGIPANQITRLNLINENARKELDYIQIEKQIKNDAGLSFKLLKYINSIFFQRKVPVDTIKDALTFLGENEIRKFLFIAVLSDIGSTKPEELVRLSIVRAYMSESCAGILKTKFTKDELFMLGLFSLMDALLDCTMSDLLDVLTFSGKMRNALSGTDSEFAMILNIITGFESGRWDTDIFEIMKTKHMEEVLPRLYVHSVRSANAFYGF